MEPVLSSRQERGLILARSKRLKMLADGKWLIPSDTGPGAYLVDTEQRTCTCPDHELRLVKCKHMWALEYARHHVTGPDGEKVVTAAKKVTYRQDWPAYNRAQTEEKDTVQILLHALCEGIQSPTYRGRGRPRTPLADVIHAATMKVYTGMSGRRADSDIRDSRAKGHIGKAPHYNSLFDYVERPELTPLLKVLIEESAAPLAAIENKFAVDGTGISTVIYHRWFDHKYGKEMKESSWVKLHIITGTVTNVVTAAEVTDGDKHDSPFLPPLVETTAKRFRMAEVSADKAYLAHKNLEAIAKVGAEAYIPFKSNSTGKGSAAWQKLWHFYSFHREEFLAKYHRRSNVEATFSMIKRKFGGSVRSKSPDAIVNECLIKVLCHNLSCLVHSIHELGIDPKFWQGPVESASVSSWR